MSKPLRVKNPIPARVKNLASKYLPPLVQRSHRLPIETRYEDMGEVFTRQVKNLGKKPVFLYLFLKIAYTHACTPENPVRDANWFVR